MSPWMTWDKNDSRCNFHTLDLNLSFQLLSLLLQLFDLDQRLFIFLTNSCQRLQSFVKRNGKLHTWQGDRERVGTKNRSSIKRNLYLWYTYSCHMFWHYIHQICFMNGGQRLEPFVERISEKQDKEKVGKKLVVALMVFSSIAYSCQIGCFFFLLLRISCSSTGSLVIQNGKMVCDSYLLSSLWFIHWFGILRQFFMLSSILLLLLQFAH